MKKDRRPCGASVPCPGYRDIPAAGARFRPLRARTRVQRPGQRRMDAPKGRRAPVRCRRPPSVPASCAGRTRLGLEPHAHEEGLLALGSGALGLEGFDGLEGATHGWSISWMSGPMKILTMKLPPGLRCRRATSRASQASLSERAWSVNLVPVVRGAMSLMTTSNGPISRRRASKASERLNTSSCMKVTCGGKAVSVVWMSQPSTSPRWPTFSAAPSDHEPGAAAQIQNAHPLAEELELRVQFLELVHGTGRIILALGLEKIMIPIFLHSDTSGLL